MKDDRIKKQIVCHYDNVVRNINKLSIAGWLSVSVWGAINYKLCYLYRICNSHCNVYYRKEHCIMYRYIYKNIHYLMLVLLIFLWFPLHFRFYPSDNIYFSISCKATVWRYFLIFAKDKRFHSHILSWYKKKAVDISLEPDTNF